LPRRDSTCRYEYDPEFDGEDKAIVVGDCARQGHDTLEVLWIDDVNGAVYINRAYESDGEGVG
jgi:hypothetical protein